MSTEIEKAYKYCESVTKSHAKSFYFAAKFLPKEKQLPIYALYALCRHVDDEIDEAGIKTEIEAAASVENWREKLNEIYAGKIHISASDNAKKQVFIAWQDLLKTYKIPQNLPLELMQGVLMDTHINRYESFDNLYVYCFRVASTVGLMSSEIFGYSTPETLEYAEALGIAMQLTNILRDVGEDALMNRIYLPQEDLRKFGISEKQIFDNRMDEKFVQMMQFQIGRARKFYEKSEKGIPLLNKETRFSVLLAARIYAKILDEIEKQNYDVYSRRAHTNLKQKLFTLPNIWREARTL